MLKDIRLVQSIESSALTTEKVIRMQEALGHFEISAGNVEPWNATIMCIADPNHFSPGHEVFGELVTAFASTGDTVFLETPNWKGAFQKRHEFGLPNNVYLRPWDTNNEDVLLSLLLYDRGIKLSRKLDGLESQDGERFQRLMRAREMLLEKFERVSTERRDKTLITKIADALQSSQRRLFPIAGRDHLLGSQSVMEFLNQFPFVILTPKNFSTETPELNEIFPLSDEGRTSLKRQWLESRERNIRR